MMTIAQAVPVTLAAGGLSSSVAVAAAALVVVLTIVLVFVMVLRSNGSSRRSGAGLGYDGQMGPLGQPQNGMDDGSWGDQQGGSAGGRGWGQDFADDGQAGWGGQQGGAWGAGAGAQGMQGGMGGAGMMPQGGAWGAGAGADQGGWNAQPHVASPSRPMAPAAQGDWNAQGPVGAPMSSPSRPNWGAPEAQPGSPWDQGGQGGQGAPAWGPAQPTMPAGGPMQQPNGGWGGQQMNGNWGGPPAPPSQPGGGWNAGGPAAGGWGGAPAAQRLGVLVIRQGKEQGKTFELRKDRTTLGRSRESDIFLEDLAVSRLHTTIMQDGAGRYLLRDEGSANGTYVNEQRVNEQVLEEGDVIQVGQTILVFGWR